MYFIFKKQNILVLLTERVRNNDQSRSNEYLHNPDCGLYIPSLTKKKQV